MKGPTEMRGTNHHSGLEPIEGRADQRSPLASFKDDESGSLVIFGIGGFHIGVCVSHRNLRRISSIDCPRSDHFSAWLPYGAVHLRQSLQA